MAEHELTINGSLIRVRYSELTRSLEEQLIAEVLKLAETEFKDNKVVDDRNLATEIRKYLNKAAEFGGAEASAWHVIVGQHFVCSLKHESKSMVFFDLVDLHKSVLAFKSG